MLYIYIAQCSIILGTNWVQVQMSKSIEQQGLSFNGGDTYYLQFHIKPWMFDTIPYFKRYEVEYPNRKNYKQSLKTKSLTIALERMHNQLLQMHLVWNEQEQELQLDPKRYDIEVTPEPTPEEEYNSTRQAISKYSEDELEQYYKIETEVIEDRLEELSLSDDEFDQQELQKLNARHRAIKAAYEREFTGEDKKLDPAPHTFEITFLAATKLLVKEYEEDDRNPKTIGKIDISANKFLEFLGIPDLVLTKIRRLNVKHYIQHSRKKSIPLNTFSNEFGLLEKIYQIAQDDGYISANILSPFQGFRPLKGFKEEESKGLYTPEHTHVLATEALSKGRIDILTNIAVSYYTGMRSSELYDCTLEVHESIKYLDIKDGKTVTSVRPVPLHPHLEQWLTDNKLLPEPGQKFSWPNTTADAFNKSFNRFSKTNLIKKHNVSETEGRLSHHSFRHGMSTRLHEKGLSELEVAHVVGHKQGTVAKTTSGKTYIKKAQIPTILGHIKKIEPIELPNTNAHEP